jgi:hypothetical protein
MLLPYYIASMNIEHAYYERQGEYEVFPGLCFVDTLDMAEDRQMSMFAEKNTERVARQRRTPFTVIIGNPPYNVCQLNENDNNKNRRYPVIDCRIRETYAKDSKATNKNALSDAYVKFFRWATDRWTAGRHHLSSRTTALWTRSPSTDAAPAAGLTASATSTCGNVGRTPNSAAPHNVFGIQVGVGIADVAARRSASATTVSRDVAQV